MGNKYAIKYEEKIRQFACHILARLFAFQLINLASDLGGTFGLWVGLSILSLFEVIELALSSMLLLLRCSNKNKVQENHKMNGDIV